MPTQFIEDTSCREYRLTKTQLKDDLLYRWISLANIKKYLPKPGHATDAVLHYPNGSDSTYIALTKGGRLSIGCVTFGLEATQAIFRAAGIRLGHAKAKGKAKSKAKKGAK